MKLKKVKDFYGEESANSSGVCWTFDGLHDDYCIQFFSEYYGLYRATRLYKKSEKDIVGNIAVDGFFINMKDLRNDTVRGKTAVNNILEIIEKLEKEA